MLRKKLFIKLKVGYQSCNLNAMRVLKEFNVQMLKNFTMTPELIIEVTQEVQSNARYVNEKPCISDA